MAIDFSLSPELETLRDKTAEFVRSVVIPAEPTPGDATDTEALRRELQAKARDAGLFAPHMSKELGGLGLDMRGQAVIFEEAGYSLLGPLALNCSAPDEGNMHLLNLLASDDQRGKYLEPLVAGEIRSCFAMTEPAPGAGSDPSMLRTSAVRDGGDWVISGHKWYVSGANGAAFTICMARTSADGEPPAATMFLVEDGHPGYRVVREIPSIDTLAPGGHCELLFEDCRVSESAVLGEAGKGFDYAQARLVPARLTHCMRWLGAARRAHDFAMDRVVVREGFGRPLAEHGMIQQMVADNEIDIAASRALIWQTAWKADTGAHARHDASITKTFVSEAVNRVIDRSVQMCGSLGVSGDAPLGTLLREVRPFRIYDGPSESHRWSIARRAFRRRAASGG